jgi:hypothetical protein
VQAPCLHIGCPRSCAEDKLAHEACDADLELKHSKPRQELVSPRVCTQYGNGTVPGANTVLRAITKIRQVIPAGHTCKVNSEFRLEPTLGAALFSVIAPKRRVPVPL